jgi:hypothetical protein
MGGKIATDPTVARDCLPLRRWEWKYCPADPEDLEGSSFDRLRMDGIGIILVYWRTSFVYLKP